MGIRTCRRIESGGEMEKDYKDSFLHERILGRWGDEALAWAREQNRRKARGIVEHVREELGEQAADLTDEEIIEEIGRAHV